MSAAIVVHLATDAHAVQIAERSRDYIEHGVGWSWTRTRVIKAIRGPETNVAVVLERDRVLAFGIMNYLDRHAHLQLLAVLPANRRREIASAILRWLESVAQAAGVERILVECRKSNAPARSLYLDHAFHERVIEASMYAGVEDGVLLEKWLRPRATTTGNA